MKIGEQLEKDAAAAADDAEATKTCNKQQQQQQPEKTHEVKKTQAQTAQGKKRNSPSREKKIQCQTQSKQEDVSSWPQLM